jgi:hypothetical protein
MCTLCRQTDSETQMYIEMSLFSARSVLVFMYCALFNAAWKDTCLLTSSTLSCPYNILSFKGQIRPQGLWWMGWGGGGVWTDRGKIFNISPRIRPQEHRSITQKRSQVTLKWATVFISILSQAVFYLFRWWKGLGSQDIQKWFYKYPK